MNKITNKILTILTVLLLVGCDNDVESDNKSITLNGPTDNATIEIMTSVEKRYVDAMYQQAQGIDEDLKYKVNDLNGDNVKIKDYVTSYTEGKGIKVDLGFNHKGFGKDKTYIYHIASKSDFSDELKILSKSTAYAVHSLKSNTKYYWKVTDIDNNITSETKTFTTTLGWRGINAGLTNNIRDIGGHIVKGNKIIKQGLIYRGCELNLEAYNDGSSDHNKTIDDNTIYTFKNIMKIGTEIDFRGAAESGSLTSSNMGWSVNYDRQSIAGYGSLVQDKTGSEDKKVKKIFEHFLDAKEDKSIYFHCWGGADRTGTIAFLLGGLLGMSYTDLIIDYELTSFSYNLREHDVLGTYSNFPSLIEGLKAVTNHTENNPDIQEMCKTYLMNKVGISEENITKIQDLMLEDL